MGHLAQFLGDYMAEVLNHERVEVLVYTIGGPSGDDMVAVRLTLCHGGRLYHTERVVGVFDLPCSGKEAAAKDVAELPAAKDVAELQRMPRTYPA